jgi:hypothetical protein
VIGTAFRLSLAVVAFTAIGVYRTAAYLAGADA